MLKSLIAPLQKVLMQKKYCPACTRPLTRGKSLGRLDGEELIVCECKRIFVHDIELDVYRRALQDDIKRIM